MSSAKIQTKLPSWNSKCLVSVFLSAKAKLRITAKLFVFVPHAAQQVRSVLKTVAKALGNPLHFDRQFWIHLIPTKRLELCNEVIIL